MTSIYHLPGDPAGFDQYGRFDNPTWVAVEKMLGHLEDATAVAFPSGMAATSAVFFGLLKTGDRILLPSDGYYTTRMLAERFLKPMGIAIDTRPTATFLDGGFDGYRLVFVESPSNPNLDICDIAAVAAAAHAGRRDRRRRQHDDDALRPAPARPRRRRRGGSRHQGAERPFGRAARPRHEPQRGDHRRGHGLAEPVGRHPRSVRGLAGASRAGDAGGPLRPHVHVGRNDRRAPRRASGGRRGALSRDCPTIPPTISPACRWTASAS